MVGGGIKATGGGDQFSGQLHACEHLASRFVVVAGGCEDFRDAAGGEAVLQEAEDGLPLGGVQGTSRQARKVGAIPLSEPLDGGDTFIGKEDIVGEDGRFAQRECRVVSTRWWRSSPGSSASKMRLRAASCTGEAGPDERNGSAGGWLRERVSRMAQFVWWASSMRAGKLRDRPGMALAGSRMTSCASRRRMVLAR